MCHGYYNFFIILRLNIYAQTHTEKGVSITKISAYKLDKHAVNIIFGLKIDIKSKIDIKTLTITQDISYQKFRST